MPLSSHFYLDLPQVNNYSQHPRCFNYFPKARSTSVFLPNIQRTLFLFLSVHSSPLPLLMPFKPYRLQPAFCFSSRPLRLSFQTSHGRSALTSPSLLSLETSAFATDVTLCLFLYPHFSYGRHLHHRLALVRFRVCHLHPVHLHPVILHPVTKSRILPSGCEPCFFHHSFTFLRSILKTPHQSCPFSFHRLRIHVPRISLLFSQLPTIHMRITAYAIHLCTSYRRFRFFLHTTGFRSRQFSGHKNAFHRPALAITAVICNEYKEITVLDKCL